MALEVDRRETLLQCFKALDRDHSGYIEFWELRAIAKQITPKQNLDDAEDLLRYLDTDHDNRVSFAEFLQLMEPLMEPLDDVQFEMHVNAILKGDRPDEALNEPGYKHRQDCRLYLTSEVVPYVRQGLLELVKAVEQQRIQLAAGAQWDSDGYLPHHWAPFSPLRWLGTWMLERACDAGGEEVDGSKHGAVEDWLSTHINPHRTFAEMSRHDKVALAFRHLDRDCSGCLDASELLAMSGKLHKDQDLVYAQKLLQSMDTNENGRVDFAEYCHFVLQLTEVLTDAEFEAAIHKLLGSTHLSYCHTRGDKLRFLFHELDQDESGMIAVDEVEAIARRLDPDATPWKIQSALEAFDRQEPTHVNIHEFVSVVEGLVSHIKDGSVLDSLIATVIEGKKVGASLAPSDPMDEVEPQELKDLAKHLPVAQHTLQIGCIEVMDAIAGASGAPMLLVDVRSPEEVQVSTIPGAVHCPAVMDEALPHKWSATGMEKLQKHLAVMAVLPGGAAATAALDAARGGSEQDVVAHSHSGLRIVAFCNTGERSGAASIAMAQELGMPVRSLCGGILNYYNQGGNVCDTQGQIVQAVHPGIPPPDLQHLVVRPNTFKFHHDP